MHPLDCARTLRDDGAEVSRSLENQNHRIEVDGAVVSVLAIVFPNS